MALPVSFRLTIPSQPSNIKKVYLTDDGKEKSISDSDFDLRLKIVAAVEAFDFGEADKLASQIEDAVLKSSLHGYIEYSKSRYTSFD